MAAKKPNAEIEQLKTDLLALQLRVEMLERFVEEVTKARAVEGGK